MVATPADWRPVCWVWATPQNPRCTHYDRYEFVGRLLAACVLSAEQLVINLPRCGETLHFAPPVPAFPPPTTACFCTAFPCVSTTHSMLFHRMSLRFHRRQHAWRFSPIRYAWLKLAGLDAGAAEYYGKHAQPAV